MYDHIVFWKVALYMLLFAFDKVLEMIGGVNVVHDANFSVEDISMEWHGQKHFVVSMESAMSVKQSNGEDTGTWRGREVPYEEDENQEHQLGVNQCVQPKALHSWEDINSTLY